MSTQIQQKATQLRDNGFDLGNPQDSEKDAGYTGKLQEFQHANIYYHSQMGAEAHVVGRGILRKYLALGGQGPNPQTGKRVLGFPLTDEMWTDHETYRCQHFEFGSIYNLFGSVQVSGKINEYYTTLGRERSFLGYPIADPLIVNGALVQYFEFGGLWCEEAGNGKMIEWVWENPQLGKPWLLKAKELEQRAIIRLRSKEVQIGVGKARTIFQTLFKDSLFLHETASSTDVPLEFVTNRIKVAESPKHDWLMDGFQNYSNQQYQTSLKVKTGEKIEDSILYDLTLQLPGGEKYTLAPHSIYFKQKWTKAHIAHITDLHIARRNDGFRKQLVEAGMETTAAKSYNNPNDRLREFIQYANKLHKLGQLDFILATGDLVDYVFEDGGNVFRNMNFPYLFEILLGKDPAPDQVKSTELKVPIFTTLGNHDYRSNAYYLYTRVENSKVDITYTTQEHYSGFNLTKDEGIALTPPLKVEINRDEAVRQIIPVATTLHGPLYFYFRNINRTPSYTITFGDNAIVMIDGKCDAAVINTTAEALAHVFGTESDDARQFAAGTPNSVGFNDLDLELVKDALNQTEGVVIVGVHNPVVNPVGNSYPYFLRESLRQTSPRAYKEEMKKYLVRTSSGMLTADFETTSYKGWRLDNKPFFAVGNGDELLDFGVMRGKKMEFLQLCNGVGVSKPVTMVLSGHIHVNAEFRTKYNPTDKTFSFYTDFYTENPTAYELNVDCNIHEIQNMNPQKMYIVDKDSQKTFNVAITADAGINEPIRKNSNGTFTMRTKPNGASLDQTKEGARNLWWNWYQPLFIQTGALGPMNSQRGGDNVLHSPDVRGCRTIAIENKTIKRVHYVTQKEIDTTINKVAKPTDVVITR